MSSLEVEETPNEIPTEIAYQKVQEWMESIYGSNGVPDFEVNAKTIAILHKIMMCTISSNNDASELLKHKEHLSEFYLLEAGKINESLKLAGITMDKLSNPCQLAVKSLSLATCYLDLKNPPTDDFLLGLNNLSKQQMDVSKESRALIHLMSQFTKRLSSVLLTNQQLQRDLKTKEGSLKTLELQEEKRARQTEFLQGKQGEYGCTIKSLEDALISCGATPDICHKALVTRSEEIKQMEAKLSEITAKLKSFQNLPPNENLARLKIEESKEELLKLEAELQMKISTK